MNVLFKKVTEQFKRVVGIAVLLKANQINLPVGTANWIKKYIESLEKENKKLKEENEKLFLDNQELREMLYY